MENALLMMDDLLGMISQIGMYYAALGLLFTLLIKGRECNAGTRYWQRQNILTDLLYWFIVPLFGKYVKLVFIFMIVHYALGLQSPQQQKDYFLEGYGPLSQLPLLVQMVMILVMSDVILYWTHRAFHSRYLWKIHAVHHSSKELDWPSAYRFHPINIWLTFTLVDIGMVLLGFSPEAFVYLAPFNVFYSAFVHANLNWTLGPLGQVLASPVFHRWHHTAANKGGSKNFAPTFPVLDRLFGTYYMPKGELPGDYGVDDPHFPTDHFIDQLFYPFRKKR